MPQPGFYNDNEYRAYPFVFKPGVNVIPDSAVVDAGIIMRLDADFNETQHTVWLAQVTRAGSQFLFDFRTDAHSSKIRFTRDVTATDWQSEYAISDTVTTCGDSSDPVWEGFLVTGPLTALAAALPTDGVINIAQNSLQLEPGRIQNIAKTYIRTINVGNYSRVPGPGSTTPSDIDRTVIVNRTCMHGDIRFKEGYNCSIRQTDAVNELRISAAAGAGTKDTTELCEFAGELEFFDGERTDPGSFLSGGPKCSDLIATVNGLSGPNITFVAGAGIEIITQASPPSITIRRNLTTSQNCERT